MSDDWIPAFEDVLEAWLHYGRPHTTETYERSKEAFGRWCSAEAHRYLREGWEQGWTEGFGAGYEAGDEAGFAEGLDHNR